MKSLNNNILKLMILNIFVFHIIYIKNVRAELLEAAKPVRVMGMGGAGAATIDGIDALFVNPAGLNRNKGVHLTVLNPAITVNTSAWDTVQDFKSLTSGSSLREYIQPFVGRSFGGEFNNYTGLTLKNFGAAFFTDVALQETLHNLALPELKLKTYYQYGLKFGGAVGFLKDDIIKFGFAVKWLNLRGVNDRATTELLLSQNAAEFTKWADRWGHGYGLDLGLVLDVPTESKYIKPSVALSWQDVFTTTIKKVGDSEKNPMAIKDNLTLGIGTIFDLPLLKISWAFDVKHMTQRGVQIPMKLHTGIEFIFPVLSFAVGLNQGYYTASVGFNLFLLKIQAATYGEELGVYPGQNEDRKYVLQMIGGFSLFN